MLNEYVPRSSVEPMSMSSNGHGKPMWTCHSNSICSRILTVIAPDESHSSAELKVDVLDDQLADGDRSDADLADTRLCRPACWTSSSGTLTCILC